MDISVYLVLFAGALLGGIAVLFVTPQKKTLKLLLAFSGAYLFSITVLHLIPEVYASGQSSATSIGVFILIGFFLQILLEFFSEGIEHGHIHIHKEHNTRFPLTLMLSLCIHSFLEGMPLSQTSYINENTQRTLLAGILLHNIPVSVALTSMLIQSSVKKSWAIASLILFALMAPLGALTNYFIASGAGTTEYMSSVMGLVIGIFLHISTTILFESSENHRFNLVKFLVIIVGASLALIYL